MRNKRYEAFTLIEMLVVMGILIILMVIGIAAGRFALFRAADVAHRNGADQLAEGLQAYYVDNRAFPQIDSCEGASVCNPAKLMLEADKLSDYMDRGSFSGGSGATYLYFTGGDNNDQAFLICVSMRGTKDVNDTHTEGAYYCSGNAYNVDLQHGAGPLGVRINQSLIEVTNSDDEDIWDALVALGDSPANGADWDDQRWLDEEPPL